MTSKPKPSRALIEATRLAYCKLHGIDPAQRAKLGKMQTDSVVKVEQRHRDAATEALDYAISYVDPESGHERVAQAIANTEARMAAEASELRAKMRAEIVAKLRAEAAVRAEIGGMMDGAVASAFDEFADALEADDAG